MEQCFSFVLLTEQLTTEEYNKFITKCIQEQGQQAFNNIMVHGLKTRPELFVQFSQWVSTIINSRASTTTISQTRCDSLLKLPSCLVAECASYLQLFDYLAFGKSCRDVYVCIYSPSKIHQFDYHHAYFTNNNIKRFKNIKQVIINNNHFAEISNFVKSQLMNIDSIQYLAIIEDRFSYIYVSELLASINTSNVKTFMLSFSCNLMLKEFGEIMDLLPKLNNLGLKKVTKHFFIWEEKSIKIICKNIKSLAFYTGCGWNLSYTLINALKDQLRALLIEVHCLVVNWTKFPKLMELILILPTIALLKSFKYVPNIETFVVYDYPCYVDADFIQNLLQNSTLLKYFAYYSNIDGVIAMIQCITKSLLSTLNNRRQSDLIFLEFSEKYYISEIDSEKWYISETEDKDWDSNLLVDCIRDLIRCLLELNFSNWRIKLVLVDNSLINKCSKFIGEIQKDFMINQGFISYTKCFFVISNKGCNVCGYHIRTINQHYCLPWKHPIKNELKDYPLNKTLMTQQLLQQAPYS